MFQATRRRLALWYTAVTAVLLLLFALGVYMYVRSTLIERVDDTLNHVVEIVVRSLVIEPTNPPSTGDKFHLNVEATFPGNTNTVEDDHIDIEWFSPTGELLFSTLSEPLNIPVQLNRTGETVHLSTGQVLRQVTERIEIGRQVIGYLRVSHPWFEVTKPIRQLLFDLSLGITFMVICVAAIGWLLSELAMKPVRESYQRLKQFTADASHELRSPIAMIQTNVQVALADPDPMPALQRQQLQVVERLTQRLGRLVDDLLFLARSDSGIVQIQQEPCPLDALLMQVMEEQQLVADQKHIALSLNIKGTPSQDLVIPPNTVNDSSSEEDAFTLLGDWDQLVRLFTNLISNALQYTTEKGQVQVELQELHRPSQTHLQAIIRDTGKGIPESALPHIFDRFYRVDPARTHNSRRLSASTGSGLGLAIAATIVESHQGHIQIESTLNQGTTVTVTLPTSSLQG
jgi:OmpR-family two-component system manganese-sensing sensor histidine kinase